MIEEYAINPDNLFFYKDHVRAHGGAMDIIIKDFLYPYKKNSNLLNKVLPACQSNCVGIVLIDCKSPDINDIVDYSRSGERFRFKPSKEMKFDVFLMNRRPRRIDGIKELDMPISIINNNESSPSLHWGCHYGYIDYISIYDDPYELIKRFNEIYYYELEKIGVRKPQRESR